MLCRCSGQGEIAADALSKGYWETARAAMLEKNDDPGKIPVSLLKWIHDPVPEFRISHKEVLLPRAGCTWNT